MRFLYTLAMYLATPLIVLRLALRGFRSRPYYWRWAERFGFFAAPRGVSGCLWVHAVSVGEVNAAEPLVKALKQEYPTAPLVITTVTPTGTARVQQLFGDSVFHVYLPYDLPYAVNRFLRVLKPRIALIVETEIWPNLYFACRRHRVPLMIVNARLSERSLRGYRPRPLRGMLREALGCVDLIAAQSQADVDRYRLIGAPPRRVFVCGNLKYDMRIPPDARPAGARLREHWGATRPVWIAASTHEGEEQAVFSAHLAILQRLPDALLLVAPRHPERFAETIHAARGMGFAVGSYGTDGMPAVAHQVFVIDAMGQLMPFFAAAGLAFVGGSLVPVGGHNVLEPAALGTPVVVGPHTFNFAEITTSLIAQGGAVRVGDADQLGASVLALLGDAERRSAMGRAAQRLFERERGATGRLLQLIDAHLA